MTQENRRSLFDRERLLKNGDGYLGEAAHEAVAVRGKVTSIQMR